MIEAGLLVVAFIAVGIPLALNLVGPLVIWRTQKLPAQVSFEPLDGDAFLRHGTPRFFEFHQSIVKRGFRSMGDSKLPDTHSDIYFRLYSNPALRLAAMVVTASSKVDEMTYIEFFQRFDDGTTLSVSNLPRQESFPKLWFKVAFRFPAIVDAGELLKAHLQLKSLLKEDRDPQTLDFSNGFDELEIFMQRESDALVKKGLIRPAIDPDGNRALTVLGAYILTWRSIFPGKNIVGFLAQRESREIIRHARRLPAPALPPEGTQPGETLRAIIEGTIHFVEAMGDDAGHMMVFLEEYGDRGLFISGEAFDEMGLDEGQKVRLDIEIRSNPYIGENQTWIAARRQ